jgi:hypothetical protein
MHRVELKGDSKNATDEKVFMFPPCGVEGKQKLRGFLPA